LCNYRFLFLDSLTMWNGAFERKKVLWALPKLPIILFKYTQYFKHCFCSRKRGYFSSINV
jgi:hypothetical protein